MLYPGLGLALGGIQDPELAVASCRVYNDWIADYASTAPDRLVGVGALPMQDPDACVHEIHRMVDLGLRAGFTRPNPVNKRPLHDPAFDVVYRARRDRVAAGVSPGRSLRSAGGSASAWPT